MQTLTTDHNYDAAPRHGWEPRAAYLHASAQDETHRRTDRMFANLMIVQWLAGIAAALWISPRTWAGTTSQIHMHVWASIFLGAAITAGPVLLAWKHAGSVWTRQVIAFAQMLTSALLIHLTGGRIETHFHVFGSLAFLAFYRDWRVLLTATVIVAADHMLRGLFWPQSVFGVLVASNWRWLEHAGWVLFEDTFLFIFIRQSLRDMRDVAVRQAQLEKQNAEIELKVQERTADLTSAHQQLLIATRHAGMAEVATNVLHNVGNVLNSVNVSAEGIGAKVRQLRVANLKNVAGMIREHSHDLGNFLTTDPRGRELPDYLVKLADNLAEPQYTILEEVASLRKNLEHIKEIVAMQQSYSRRSSVREKCTAMELAEDAIRINSAAMNRHQVRVIREYRPMPPLMLDRHEVLQILVNLLSNAKYAMRPEEPDKRVVVRVGAGENNRLRIEVADNGVGIPADNLTRIFQHGFTTKKDGHGFGLHSSALAAHALGGSLLATSDGPGHGAVFTLELPMHEDVPRS
jgi:signal transduction histidine kinase